MEKIVDRAPGQLYGCVVAQFKVYALYAVNKGLQFPGAEVVGSVGLQHGGYAGAEGHASLPAAEGDDAQLVQLVAVAVEEFKCQVSAQQASDAGDRNGHTVGLYIYSCVSMCSAWKRAASCRWGLLSGGSSKLPMLGKYSAGF